MKTLLVAIRPDDKEMLQGALGMEFRLVFCHTLSAARDALDNRFDGIVCGLHFDDGNMFELLQQVRTRSANRHTRFIGIKGVGGWLSPAIYRSIVIALEKMGADGFVDVGDIRATLGDEAAYAALRKSLHAASGDPD